MECRKCLTVLNEDNIISLFTIKDDDDTIKHAKDFVNTHNSSISEKSSTTYELIDNENILGYFVISLGTIQKDSKSRTFFTRHNLNHDWYSVINLEFIIRKPGNDYEGLGDVIFNYLDEIIKYIEEKIVIKYIFVLSIRKRICYFENKGFIPICEKTRKNGKKELPMLLEI